MVLAACDLFQGGTGGGTTTQETPGDLVINGKDSESKPVRVEFSRPTAPAKAALIPSTLKNNDIYKIFHNGVLVSSGIITINGSTVTFTPVSPYSGNPFQGTFGSSSSGISTITFPDGVIPLPNGTITGFVSDGSGGGSNDSAAKTIVDQLNKDNANSTNAEVYKGNVLIKGPLTAIQNITIQDGVKLIFSAREEDEFTINSNVKVTARGGIEVPGGKGMTIAGDGSLVVEGNSAISGKLNISKGTADGTTLDVFGNVTIESGGVLSLAGDATVVEVYNTKYSKIDNATLSSSSPDAILKMSGTLTVKRGGRFQIPDPTEFNLKKLTGGMVIESGGELIIVTCDRRGKKDLYPVIGTVDTGTEGFPVGADYVMDPNASPNSKIEVRVNSGVPVLELTGRAIALGRLIVKEYDYEHRKPPFRNDVWLVFPFTVAENSELQVGNSSEVNSSLFITGSNGTVITIKSTGVLTNKGRVLIFKNSGIVEWYGGFFNHNNRVFRQSNGTTISRDGPYGFKVYGETQATFWKDDWKPYWWSADNMFQLP